MIRHVGRNDLDRGVLAVVRVEQEGDIVPVPAMDFIAVAGGVAELGHGRFAENRRELRLEQARVGRNIVHDEDACSHRAGIIAFLRARSIGLFPKACSAAKSRRGAGTSAKLAGAIS